MNTVFTWWIVGEFITLVPKIDTATVQIYDCSMLTNIVYALTFTINCGLTCVQQLFKVQRLTK